MNGRETKTPKRVESEKMKKVYIVLEEDGLADSRAFLCWADADLVAKNLQAKGYACCVEEMEIVE